MTASFLSPVFVIGHIRIGTIEGASCVNMGNNYPANFTSNKKHNQGFGSISGDHNDVEGIRAALNDADVLDMLNAEDYRDLPDWLKKMMLEQGEQESGTDQPEDTQSDGSEAEGESS